MNVLSLFDGISCGYLALQIAEIPIENYYAYEIDKYALQVSKTRFPQIQYFGDVRDADFSFHKNIDLLIGGSPCTDLSCAKQNRQGLKGKQSSLFWEFVRAYEEKMTQKACLDRDTEIYIHQAIKLLDDIKNLVKSLAITLNCKIRKDI